MCRLGKRACSLVDAHEGQLVRWDTCWLRSTIPKRGSPRNKRRSTSRLARASANNDVNLRFAKKSVEVAKAELRRSSESNEKYARTVSTRSWIACDCWREEKRLGGRAGGARIHGGETDAPGQGGVYRLAQQKVQRAPGSRSPGRVSSRSTAIAASGSSRASRCSGLLRMTACAEGMCCRGCGPAAAGTVRSFGVGSARRSGHGPARQESSSWIPKIDSDHAPGTHLVEVENPGSACTPECGPTRRSSRWKPPKSASPRLLSQKPALGVPRSGVHESRDGGSETTPRSRPGPATPDADAARRLGLPTGIRFGSSWVAKRPSFPALFSLRDEELRSWQMLMGD